MKYRVKRNPDGKIIEFHAINSEEDSLGLEVVDEIRREELENPEPEVEESLDERIRRILQEELLKNGKAID